MTPEEIYDTEIAPALHKVASRCRDLGFNMDAQVEYAPGETGFTSARGRVDQCAAQRLVHYAMLCQGNFDNLVFTVMRDAGETGHSSLVLRQLNVPATPVKR